MLEQLIDHDHEEIEMFTTLPESHPACARSLGGTIVSLLLHGTLVATAVTLTMTGSAVATSAPASVHRDSLVYIPVDHAAIETRPTGRKTPSASTRILREPPPLSSLPDIQLPGAPVPADWLPGISLADSLPGPHRLGGGGIGSDGERGSPVGPDGIVGEHEVDRSPRMLGGTSTPRYPDVLRDARITGSVVAEFVVDTSGRAEPASLTVIETTRPEFADAVRAALPRLRFVPGERAGAKVRTRVRMPFAFTLR